MLSRVADAVYWMSRYVERAENVARFIDVNLGMMLEAPAGQRPGWEPLVLTTGDHDWFARRYGEFSAATVTRFLSFDREYPNSIVSSIARARENARSVREIISREMWQALNEFYLMVSSADQDQQPLEERSEFFGRVKLFGIHFAGVTDATLSHGDPWHFARLGRMLERADKTSRILDVKYFILLPTVRDVGTTLDQLGWAALLSSASALQMYRQRYHVTHPTHVAEFLLLDAAFPRSIRHCVGVAEKSLHALGGGKKTRDEAEQRLDALRAELDSADIEEIVGRGLHQYLDRIQVALNDIGSAIGRRFFNSEA
jgi:uncharacterized alpha-E superfamily protein